MRDVVARALDRLLAPAAELTRLQQQMQAAYAEVSENLEHNTALQLIQQEDQLTVRSVLYPPKPNPST